MSLNKDHQTYNISLILWGNCVLHSEPQGESFRQSYRRELRRNVSNSNLFFCWNKPKLLKRQHRNREAGENECYFENINGTALKWKGFDGEVKASNLSYVSLIELHTEFYRISSYIKPQSFLTMCVSSPLLVLLVSSIWASWTTQPINTFCYCLAILFRFYSI